MVDPYTLVFVMSRDTAGFPYQSEELFASQLTTTNRVERDSRAGVDQCWSGRT